MLFRIAISTRLLHIDQMSKFLGQFNSRSSPHSLRFMKRKHFWLGGFIAILVVLMPLNRSVQAQFPLLPNFSGNSSTFLNQSSEQVVSGCIRVDGRCLIEIGANQSDLSARITEIEQRLNDIARYYFQNQSAQLSIRKEAVGQLIDIYIAVDQREIRLLSVTNQDATVKAMSIEQRAEQMVRDLENGLRRAKREREPSFLVAQGQKGAIALVFLIIATIALYKLEKKARQQQASIHASLENTSEQAISTQITQNQRQPHSFFLYFN